MLIGISDALSDSTAHVDKHDRNRRPHHRRKHGVTGNLVCESTEGRLRVAVSFVCFRRHKTDRNERAGGWSFVVSAMGSETWVECVWHWEDVLAAISTLTAVRGPLCHACRTCE